MFPLLAVMKEQDTGEGILVQSFPNQAITLNLGNAEHKTMGETTQVATEEGEERASPQMHLHCKFFFWCCQKKA